MFAHCQTFAQLNTAYENAVEEVRAKHKRAVGEAFSAAMETGQIPPSDPRFAEWDTLKSAMQARWDELNAAGAE